MRYFSVCSEHCISLYTPLYKRRNPWNKKTSLSTCLITNGTRRLHATFWDPPPRQQVLQFSSPSGSWPAITTAWSSRDFCFTTCKSQFRENPGIRIRNVSSTGMQTRPFIEWSWCAERSFHAELSFGFWVLSGFSMSKDHKLNSSLSNFGREQRNRKSKVDQFWYRSPLHQFPASGSKRWPTVPFWTARLTKI